MKKVVFGLKYGFGGLYKADTNIAEWLADNKNWRISNDVTTNPDIWDIGTTINNSRYLFLKKKGELVTNKDLIECIEQLSLEYDFISAWTTLEVVEFPDDVFEFIDKIVTQIRTYLEKNDCVNDEGFTFDRLMALIKEKYYQR